MNAAAPDHAESMAIARNLIATYEKLRQNDDPSVKRIAVHLFSLELLHNGNNTSQFAVLLGEALQSNDFVEKVALVFSSKWTRLEDWRPFLRVLIAGSSGRSSKIRRIFMFDFHRGVSDLQQAQFHGEDRERMVSITGSILQELKGALPHAPPAEQQSSLKDLVFYVPVPQYEICSFLDDAPPLFEHLAFHLFDIEPSSPAGDQAQEGAISAVAAAVERRNNIKPLKLTFPCTDSVLKLIQNFSKRKLSFENSYFSVLMDNEYLDEACLPRIIETLSRGGIKLETVIFGVIQSQAVLQQVLRFVALSNLKYVAVDVKDTSDWPSVLEVKRDSLIAVKRNFSLRKVEIKSEDEGVEFWDDADTGKIKSYMKRNFLFAWWVQHPQFVPKNLWPRVLRVALEAGGPGPLYQSLLAISGDLMGTTTITTGSKKRKRAPPLDEHQRPDKRCHKTT